MTLVPGSLNVEKGQYVEQIFILSLKSEQKGQKNFKHPLKIVVLKLDPQSNSVWEWGFGNVILSRGISHDKWINPFTDS